MFWFDSGDDRAVFIDRRVETHTLKDKSVNGGQRKLVIRPNIQADFSKLPFVSNYFQMVVFDPPHFDTSGQQSWLRAKYGALDGNWRAMLRAGFAECFRVMSPGGTLVFKWNEYQIPVSEVLALTPENPLFGHQSGKHSKTHWIAFVKSQHCRCNGSTMSLGDECLRCGKPLRHLTSICNRITTAAVNQPNTAGGNGS